jgi:acetyl-CoA C-acetyltransferase
MAGSIKDKVAIIGMGCTKFGENWKQGANDMIIEAAYEAYADAGIDPKDIDAAWLGTFYTSASGLSIARPLKLQYKPVTRVENFCATGTEALRGAAYAVAAGVCDIALAVGFEKLKDSGYSGLEMGAGVFDSFVHADVTGPGQFAMMATRYFARYGLSPQEGKEMIGKISVKSHHNGSLCPKAHFQREVSLEQVLKAPIIAAPLGLFDCCGVSDGAAAAIVTRADLAKNFRKDPIRIKALQIAVGGENTMKDSYDFTHVDETCAAAAAAYKEAGITNPREEISMAQVHDCFSITEAVTMEDLQFSQRGKVREDIESGFFNLDGGLPVNTDGGLKCFGHPIGASGIRMMYECYKQLQGKADKRQLKDPKLALTHNLGGQPPGAIVAVAIVGQ